MRDISVTLQDCQWDIIRQLLENEARHLEILLDDCRDDDSDRISRRELRSMLVWANNARSEIVHAQAT